MQPINYGSKTITWLKLYEVFQKFDIFDQTESSISNFEISMKFVTAEVHDLKAKMAEIEKKM